MTDVIIDEKPPGVTVRLPQPLENLFDGSLSVDDAMEEFRKQLVNGDIIFEHRKHPTSIEASDDGDHHITFVVKVDLNTSKASVCALHAPDGTCLRADMKTPS